MLLLKSILGSEICKYTEEINNNMLKRFEDISHIVPLKNPRRRDLDMYCLYPYLFWEDFNSVTPDMMLRLVDASIMYFDVTSYLHEIGDSPANMDIFDLWQKIYECQTAIRGLDDIYRGNDRFWSYFYEYNREYISALMLQNKHKGAIAEFDFRDFEKIAAGKSAVAKTAVAALACLSGLEEKILKIERSQDLYAQAYQLYDDLKDWKEDYRNQNYTWLLTSVISNNKITPGTDELYISECIFRDGFDICVLEQIDRKLENSMMYAGMSKPWIKVIRALQYKSSRLREDFLNIRRKYGIAKPQIMDNFFHEDEPLASLKDRDYILRPLETIKAQQEQNYPELRHWLFAVLFTGKDDLSGREECLEGDVFQRAFILNLMHDISNLEFKAKGNFFDSELEYLLQRKHEIFKTGWSYFPDLPEYCCDIDTAAEFIKLAAFNKNEQLVSEVEKAVAFIIENCSYTDGSFDTFMLDKKDSSPEALKALNAAELFWGRGADPEVNANFIYSLCLYDYQKYKDIIEAGFNWLMSKQNGSGYWESTWYAGNFYASYVCCKLFARLGARNENYDRLIRYLVGSQNSNGSWGAEGGNAQDTALAIISLKELSAVDPALELESSLEKGVSYIKSGYEPGTNMWHGVDFIKINMGRTTGHDHYVKFKSCTLTSCLCIYALTKCRK